MGGAKEGKGHLEVGLGVGFRAGRVLTPAGSVGQGGDWKMHLYRRGQDFSSQELLEKGQLRRE